MSLDTVNGGSRRPQVAILTINNDFHGLAVKKALEDTYGVDCYIIENDLIADTGGLSWATIEDFEATLPTSDGQRVKVKDLDAIWWRRIIPHGEYQLPEHITDPAHIEIIINDCRTASLGVLLTEFNGSWVSHPESARIAENKLVQLQAALRAGFRVPQTLVSQNPEDIRRFCASLNNQVVVKALSGTMKATTWTRMVDEKLLASDESLRLCPTIYQEFVTGTRHLRINCFGKTINAALIEAEELDWRANLEVPITHVELSDDLKARLHHVLELLNLKMGIVDLKINDEGEPVWLEVNPQGQFLFLEGICGMPLTAAMSEFLYNEARQVSEKRPGMVAI